MIVEIYDMKNKKWVEKEIDAEDLMEIPTNKSEKYDFTKAIEKVVDISVAKNIDEDFEIDCAKA